MMTEKAVTPAIGIDLGTRYSCVGVWHQDEVVIIANEAGNRTMPSYVAFTPTECLIGEDGKSQVTGNPANTIYDAQRLVGRRFDDPEVQKGIKLWPFKVIKGTDSLPKVVVAYEGREKEFSAEEISSMVLLELKHLAESYLGTTVKDAVITVPAYFNDSQRQSTKVAAHLAGLEVLQIIVKPVAAAIAYELHMKNDETNVLIFDLDDDACDVSLVTISEKGKLKVKTTGADTHFGGQDVVNKTVDYFVKKFNIKHKMDVSGNLSALGRLRFHSIRAIQELSSSTVTTIKIDSFHDGIDFSSELTRISFEYINGSFFSKCKETVTSFLRDAKINKTDVDDIVLVGGSTKIPKVHQLLQEFFNGKEPLKSIYAEEVVAYGATILAASLSCDKSEKAKTLPLLDVVPLSLSVYAHHGPRDTPIPAEKEQIHFTTTDNQRSIHFNVCQGERYVAEENKWLRNGVTPAIGIDLGTRYSCVGVWHQGKAEIIENEAGNKTTPSFVAFTPTECLIGEGAKNQITKNSANTIYDAQRLIGRRFDDTEVQKGIRLWPFKVIKGTDGLPNVVVAYKGKEKKHSAEEISSMVLVGLKNLAESYLGTTVQDAVITVPAYFNDSQRQATKVAAHLAGLDVLQILDEPVAAAIAYGLHMNADEKNVLVFDLDDDTLDVSLVTIDGKGKFTVKATGGGTHFSDQEIVNLMVDDLINEFNIRHKTNVNGNLSALAIDMLRFHSERAIQELSSSTVTSIMIKSLHKGIDFYSIITRKKFEYMSRSFFSKCIETLESFLRDAKINKTNVDDIVLVGGLTSIPKVHQLLQEFFNGKELFKSIHAKEVVAYGATIFATNLSREKNEKARNLQLLDTVPLSLGVDAHDGVFSVIIPRNIPIPAKKEKIYFTTRDNQRSISFNIYQGERSRAKDNKVLGKFEVEVAPAPKGKSKVRVVFCVDADGIFNCWAKEFTTGLKKKIIIDNDKMKLSEEEIKKTVKDAEKYTLEDKEYKKVMCARNVLEEYIYNVRRKMKTIGSTDKTRLHAEEIKKMDNAIEVTSQYIDGNHELADVDEYQKVLKELEKLCVGVIAQLV